jgi:hypothetical protein
LRKQRQRYRSDGGGNDCQAFSVLFHSLLAKFLCS